MLKKDCMVASELAQQYIYKTIEQNPSSLTRSEIFKLNHEISALQEQNTYYKQEITRLSEENSKLNSKSPMIIIEDQQLEDLQHKLSEYESYMVIEELKHENIISELENTNNSLKKTNFKISNELSEALQRVEILEKKLKESISGYSKFLIRKTAENRETQTEVKKMTLESINAIDVQKYCENLHMEFGQISRLSITDSEIFDVTALQMNEICSQHPISVFPIRKVMNFNIFHVFHSTVNNNMQTSQFSSQCKAVKIKKDLRISDRNDINILGKEKIVEIEASKAFNEKKRLNLQVCFGNTENVVIDKKGLKRYYFDQRKKEVCLDFCKTEECSCIRNSKKEKNLDVFLLSSVSLKPIERKKIEKNWNFVKNEWFSVYPTKKVRNFEFLTEKNFEIEPKYQKIEVAQLFSDKKAEIKKGFQIIETNSFGVKKNNTKIDAHTKTFTQDLSIDSTFTLNILSIIHNQETSESLLKITPEYSCLIVSSSKPKQNFETFTTNSKDLLIFSKNYKTTHVLQLNTESFLSIVPEFISLSVSTFSIFQKFSTNTSKDTQIDSEIIEKSLIKVFSINKLCEISKVSSIDLKKTKIPIDFTVQNTKILSIP